MTQHPSTEDVIRTLASRPSPRPFGPALIGLAMVAAGVAGLVPFFLALGLRADLAAALSVPTTLAKSALPLLLALLALPLALGSARPEARLPLWPLLLPLALALLLVVGQVVDTPRDRLLPEMLGHTATACLAFITALSIAPMVTGIALSRRGATTRPVLSGALIGLAAGAGAATGYALHCTEDAPLFYVGWYGLAIVTSGGLGAGLGHRYLRW
ncbi:NrsF family protein [Rhodobacter sp. Har01]|uniref:NrsF family protein n=1 Tax=Rhodobacter sp. Har01 TaxID=2883999 RepID=UPI001D072040|nr:NrsF family protein [Rhodobacter sp. Har01]MCB6178925.1 NrsF family protein [Rhodobacter sp. Har01]